MLDRKFANYSKFKKTITIELKIYDELANKINDFLSNFNKQTKNQTINDEWILKRKVD